MLQLPGVARHCARRPHRGAGHATAGRRSRRCAISCCALTLLPLERQGAEALEPFGYDLFTGVPTHLCAGRRRARALRLRGRPGRHDRGAAARQHPGRALADGRPRRHGSVSRNSVPSRSRACASRGARRRHRAARQRADDRHARRGHDRRAALHHACSSSARPSGRAPTRSAASRPSPTRCSRAAASSEIGSLRNIQLKRSGRLVATLDLYDLLLRGDTRDDVRLLSGRRDLHPAGRQHRRRHRRGAPPRDLRAEGRVARRPTCCTWPAGCRPTADPRTPRIERIDESRDAAWCVDVDLTTPAGRAHARCGRATCCAFTAVRPQSANAVTVKGNVLPPGAGGSGGRACGSRTCCRAPEDLKPGADLHYVLIRREALDTQVTRRLGGSRAGVAGSRRRRRTSR